MNTESLSSFVIQPYRRVALKGYYSAFGKDNLNELWDDNVAAVLQEQGYSIEEAPRSVYKVEKLYAALAKYAPENRPRVNMRSPHVRKGVALARACFSRPSTQPALECLDFSPDMILKITSNLKGSAGLTSYGVKKAESYVRAYERGRQIAQGSKAPEPCLAFKRTQFNDKTRLVWGYPYSMTALEGIFARPMIERFKGGCTPMAFGMPTGILGSKLRVASYHKTYAYSTDVSSFDSSLAGEIINEAFDILATWFDLDTMNKGLEVSNRHVWDIVKRYFITAPIVMPDGNVYKGKRHGVPSGSYFTQIIDSVANVIIVGTLDSFFHMGVAKEDIFVLGDDVLFWSNRKVPLEAIANFGSQTFGCQLNADKSAVFRFDETIHYLGRDWDNGVPSLPENEILKRMAQPETYRKYSSDPAERQRQVRLLLMSYASVYYNAYPIFLKVVAPQRFAWWTNVSIEARAMSKSGIEREFFQVNPDMMTGLQRFVRKYVYEDSRHGGYVPLALQFWK